MNAEKSTKRNHQNKSRRNDAQDFPKSKKRRLTPLGARVMARQHLRAAAMFGALLMFAGSAIGCARVDPYSGKVMPNNGSSATYGEKITPEKVEEFKQLCQGAGLELDTVGRANGAVRFNCKVPHTR